MATLVAYLIARTRSDISLEQSRTIAVIVLFLVGLWVLVILARPLNAWRLALVAAMGLAFVGALTIPFVRDYFDLVLPPASAVVGAVAIGAAAAGVLEVGWRIAGWSRPDHT